MIRSLMSVAMIFAIAPAIALPSNDPYATAGSFMPGCAALGSGSKELPLEQARCSSAIIGAVTTVELLKHKLFCIPAYVTVADIARDFVEFSRSSPDMRFGLALAGALGIREQYRCSKR